MDKELKIFPTKSFYPIERKWKFIAHVLDLIEEQELSNLARKIDRIITRLYGDLHTSSWVNDYDKIVNYVKDSRTKIDILDLIDDISQDSEYCVPCIVHKSSCLSCDFRKISGECGQVFSTFGKFMNKLENKIMSSK